MRENSLARDDTVVENSLVITIADDITASADVGRECIAATNLRW